MSARAVAICQVRSGPRLDGHGVFTTPILSRRISYPPRTGANPVTNSHAAHRHCRQRVSASRTDSARNYALPLAADISAPFGSRYMAVNAVDDLQFQPGGVLLAILRSKTNEYAEGQLIAVVHGQVAATEPIAARDAWLQHRAPCRVDRSLACAESRSPLNRSPGRPSRSLRKGARAAGLAAERPPTHCAPGTRPAPPSPASPWTASPPRPASNGSPASWSDTFALPRPWCTPPAVNSDSDRQPRRSSVTGPRRKHSSARVPDAIRRFPPGWC